MKLYQIFIQKKSISILYAIEHYAVRSRTQLTTFLSLYCLFLLSSYLCILFSHQLNRKLCCNYCTIQNSVIRKFTFRPYSFYLLFVDVVLPKLFIPFFVFNFFFCSSRVQSNIFILSWLNVIARNTVAIFNDHFTQNMYPDLEIILKLNCILFEKSCLKRAALFANWLFKCGG